jgi:hypothetical protein
MSRAEFAKARLGSFIGLVTNVSIPVSKKKKIKIKKYIKIEKHL